MKQILIFSFFLIAASYAISNRHISLRTTLINTLDAPVFHKDPIHINRVSKHPADQLHQYFVHVARPLNAAEQHDIEEFIGQKLGQYIPQNTYLMVATEDVAHKAAKAPRVQWVGAVNAEHKISPECFTCNEKKFDILLSNTPRDIQSTIKLAASWSSTMKSATFVAESAHIIRVTLKNTKSASVVLRWVADRPESQFIEPVYAYQSHDAYASTAIQTNGVSKGGSTTPFSDIFTGDGYVIGLADSGILQTSCFFPSGKIAKYDSTNGDTADATGHGTAVAGIMVGSSSTFTNATGVTPQANVYFFDLQTGTNDMSVPADLSTMFTPAVNNNATSFVLPFGTPASFYGKDAVSIDTFLVGNPSFVVVVSAGNGGSAADNRTLSSLAYSKNAIVVGASLSTNKGLLQAAKNGPENLAISNFPSTHDTNVLASFSSRGPTSDGRIKPDIIATGQTINTASNEGQCTAELVSGTSYAAGYAASAVTIVQEYLNEGYYGEGTPGGLGGNNPFGSPAASLVKAVIINSGVPLSTTDTNGNGNFIGLTEYPSATQGYGRIQLDKSLMVATVNPTVPNGYSSVFYDSASGTGTPATTGKVAYRTCFNTINAGPIRATLVWTDPAAAAMSQIALVNDLDLVLVDVTGTVYRVSSNDGKFDVLNNVEQVNIPDVANNTAFAVYVYGSNIPAGQAQSWSLVLSGHIETGGCAFLVDLNSIPVCPNGCTSAANGKCGIDGTCTCTAGKFTGVDCSLGYCPTSANGKVCSGNGVCDYESVSCDCFDLFSGADCSLAVTAPPPTNNQSVIINNPPPNNQEISKGLLAGLVIAAFFIGGIICLLLGGFIAVKYLERQRDKAMAQRATNDEEMQ